MRKLKLFFACLLMAVLSIGQVWATDVSDKLTASDLAATSTTYTDFSNVSKTSDAVYAGQSAKDASGNIQLRSKNSNSGIVSTTTGGTVKSVKITVGSGTNTIDVYGSNTAYTAASDLYGNNKGTKVGSLTATGTITFTDDYAYVGIRSNNGALYLSEIEITWTTSGGGGSTATLSSVAVSGTPTKTSYKAGQLFDPAGLTVTGTYSDASTAPITSGITWSYNPSQTLALNQTSIGVTATVNNIASPEHNVTGLSVTAAPTYGLVTDEADLAENDEIIIVNADADKAISTNQKTNNRAAVSVSASNNVITPGDDVQVLTLGKSNDNWTLYTGEGYLYASSSSNNNMNTQTTNDANGEWTISIAGDGTVTAIAQGANTRNEMRYNPNNGSPIFSCYASTSSMGKVKIFKKIDNTKPKAPTFSIPGGDYETAQSVELSCETTGATIRYTTDGSAPSNTSAIYSTAIPVNETTTIKAIAIKDNVSSSIASATYNIIEWLTVDEVWNTITTTGPNNAYIWGYVSQLTSFANSYYIAVNGLQTSNQLYIYKGDVTGVTLAVGDKLKLHGDLKDHQGTKEFSEGATIQEQVAKGALSSVAVDGTPTKTEYAANEDFDPTGLKVMGTYANGFVGEITEGITWGNDLTEGKVTEGTTVHVTATVSGITSLAHDVEVTVLAATLDHISLSYDAVDVYQGKDLPKPVVTAHWSDNTTSDVTALADFAGYDKNTTGNQTITVSYQFGTGDPKEATYTVTVRPIYNTELNVADALDIITTVIGNTKSSDNMVVRGIVSRAHATYNNTYWISDDGETTSPELEIYAGKYIDGDDFTAETKMKKGDEVVVTGKVIYYNNSTAEFAQNESQVTSLARVPNFTIANIASFEVGADDLEVSDLTIVADGEGAVTLPNDGSDNTDAVTIVEGKLHAVAPGAATITANLAANGIYKAATATFEVTVVAPATKYAISFDGNGATGGDAPEFDAEAAAGANITLPANTYTYTGHSFTGWKVYDENQDEVTVTANAFEMPASPVTIKAQWAEIPVWAYTYTSNVALSYTGTGEANSQVKINDEDYAAQKVGSSGNDGSVVVTVPYGTHTLHFHAVAWNGKSVTIAASGVENMSESSFTLAEDPGFKSSGTYTLQNDPVGQYFVMTFTAVTEETQITFSKTAGDDKRFMLYGVNQEGGVLPVLDHIAITGTMTNTTGWKTGDEITPEGLTVAATYTLGGTPQTPVDITDDPELEWSHAALTVGQTVVTLTATYKGKTDDVEITLDEAVVSGDPEISTDVNSRSWTVDKDAPIPAYKTFTVTLKNVATATVTKGGNNPDAFEISPATLTASGNITVSVVSTETVGTYTATITIKDDASETSKVVNVNLTVNAPETPETAVSTTSKWVVATAADLVDGAEVLITGVKDDVTYAMGGQNKNNRAAVAASVDGEDVLTPGENTMSFTLVAQETEGVFALRTSNGKYLYAAASGDNHMKTQDEVDVNAKWTLTVASAVAEGSSNRNVMQFNGGNTKLFSCYGSASQEDIQFYVPKPVTPPTPVYETVRSGLTAGNYYTVCYNKTMTAIKGASLWSFVGNDGNKVSIVEAGAPYAAGIPYLIYAESDKLEAVVEEVASPTAGSNNGLYGTFSYMDAAALSTAGATHMLKNNEIRPLGDNNHLDANRAYIVLDDITPKAAAPGRRVRTLPLQGQTATGCENIQAGEAPVKMMIDGQLFILRGEKMYDTTGRLVK